MRRLCGSDGACAVAWKVLSLAGLLLALAAPQPTHANEPELLVMPFSCAVDRGRVVLTPAPETRYPVVGPHAAHAHTACAPAQPDRCRTWQLHKFDMLCAGQRVSWLSVVEAFGLRGGAAGTGRFLVENGRLSMTLGPAWAALPSDSGRGGDASQPKVSARPHLTFQAGYAPIGAVGARFVGTVAALPTVVEVRPSRTDTRPSKAAPEPRPARALADAGVGEAGSPSDISHALNDAWVTTTTFATARGGLTLGRALAALALLSGAALAWLFVRRRSSQPSDAPADVDEPAATPGDVDDAAAICSELIARAVNLHRAAREALVNVESDNLRLILSDDLAKVQRVLLAPLLTDDVANQRWAPVRSKVTTALADLERIARIIAGVLSTARAASFTAAAVAQPAPAATPKTPAEAFEVLGINPDASRTIVKKIVDGLRQSWHPDHARDEGDRNRREDRMKQINTAWDLIRGQYAETERAA